jgi:hypothetical protein
MANMEPAGRHELGGASPIPSYDVEASNLEHFFTGFLDLVYSSRGTSELAHSWAQHNAILVVNPNKMRMSPLTGGKGAQAPDFFAEWRRWAGGGGLLLGSCWAAAGGLLGRAAHGASAPAGARGSRCAGC